MLFRRCSQCIRSFTSFSRSIKDPIDQIVFAWGAASQGVLGNGDRIEGNDQYEPAQVPCLPPNIVSISAGSYHNMAVSSDGQLFTWGRNNEWQLGRPLDRDEINFSATPRPVPSLERHNISSSFGSGVATYCITNEGLVYVMGSSKRGQLGLGQDITLARTPRRIDLPGNVVQLACGWGHTVAMMDDGRVFTWGWPAHGRLGHTFASSIEEEQEEMLSKRCVWEPKQVELLKGVKIKSIAAGSDHTLAITQDGTLLSFGDNSLGQLGRPTTQAESFVQSPVVDPLHWKVYAPISTREYESHHPSPPCSSSHHSTFPFSADNVKEDTMSSSSSSTSSKELKFLRATAGLAHNLAVMSDGSITSWGWNAQHQCGVGALGKSESEKSSELHSIIERPTSIYGLSNNRSALIGAGRVHSVVVNDDVSQAGKVSRYGRSFPCLTMTYSCGSANNGRLGTGTYEPADFPELLPDLDGEMVVDVACGYDHTMVLVLK